jgi:hypothetical protein
MATGSHVARRRRPALGLLGFALHELVLWASLYGLYLVIRGSAIGDLDSAAGHAWQLVHAEQALGLFHERDVQEALAPAAWFFTLFYLLGFGPLVATVLGWLFLRHRGVYRELRTLLLVSLGAALVFYVAYPAAPPRLVHGLGIADTVGLSWRGDGGAPPGAAHGTGSFAGIAYNPYAAMPSMHVGWALLVGWLAFRTARWLPLRALFALYPLVMGITVTATGNHYFLDSLAGATVALAAVPAVAGVRRLARSGGSRAGAARAPARAARLQLLPAPPARRPPAETVARSRVAAGDGARRAA